MAQTDKQDFMSMGEAMQPIMEMFQQTRPDLAKYLSEYTNLNAEEKIKRKCERENQRKEEAIEGEYDCLECFNKQYIAVCEYVEMYEDYQMQYRPCKCKERRRFDKLLEKSGMKEKSKQFTFENYMPNTAWRNEIKNTVSKFTHNPQNNWLYIGGQSGIGKTHICTAASIKLIMSGKPSYYVLWRDLANKLKQHINDTKYDEIIDELKNHEVLYIDDLFKKGATNGGDIKPTDSDVNIAFEIINHRSNKPGSITILSSELTLEQLITIDEALAGRIYDRTNSGEYLLTIPKDPAKNWRFRNMYEKKAPDQMSEAQ